MPFLAGLAQGFNTELEKDRALQAQKQEADTQRENAVLTHLASEHPDPEVRAHALTGLLSQATTGRGKGLKGFFNETSKNPMLPKLRELIGQTSGPGGGASPDAVAAGVAPAGGTEPPPATVGPQGGPAQPATTALPAAATGQIGPTSAGPAAPASPNTVAQPASSQPAAAAPPPGPNAGAAATTGLTAPPPTAQRGGGFMDPIAAARAKAGATAAGTVTGRMDALSPFLTPEQQRTAALGQAGVHVPMTGQFMGNNQKPDGSWVRQERYFDQTTGTWQLAEVPIATPTGLQAKPTYQALAGPDGRPHLFRVMPDNTKVDLGEKPVRDGYITGIDPDTQQQYSIAAPAVFERPRGTTPGATTPAAAAPPSGGVVGGAPSAAPRTGGNPPAGAAPQGATAPPPGPASAGNLPKGAIGRGRAKTLKETQGAFLGPDGEPQVGTALYDDKLGKYYDATDPTKEIAGFIPGKDAAEAVKVIAQTSTVESTIDRAIAAIKAAGLEGNTDPNATAQLANKYYSGKGEDPLATAVSALTDFTKIQGGSAYLQGTRSFKYIQQIQKHLPVSPGVREAAVNKLTGGLVGPKSTAARLVGGSDMSWDAPAQMIEKLELAKTSLAQVREGFTQATGKVAARATKGAGGGAGAGAGAAPPQAHPNSSLPDGSIFLGPDGKRYTKTGTNPDGSVRGTPVQ